MGDNNGTPAVLKTAGSMLWEAWLSARYEPALEDRVHWRSGVGGID